MLFLEYSLTQHHSMTMNREQTKQLKQREFAGEWNECHSQESEQSDNEIE
jgi:hypothetical protein